ncbi:thioesterase II family protein [Burkholderia humptydooensis]|uniref:thioesterase II family protein n=1 Tax=Burkholderia TaxID=32008 RepID=UPI00202A257D|nr:thioesterase domain-containing protein [Burkholderia humptydooensis]
MAIALRRRGVAGPRMLFVGALYAPSALRKANTLFEDDQSLLRTVRRFGGVDDSFAAEPEFMRYFLPVMAADLTLFNRYAYDAAQDRLDCPVVALFDTHGAHHDCASMAQWGLHTRGSFHAAGSSRWTLLSSGIRSRGHRIYRLSPWQTFAVMNFRDR